VLQVIKRFFYVTSIRCVKAHVMLGTTHSEGRTVCGKNVLKGWSWGVEPSKPVCEQCQRAEV
jgi:hypothetical protein